MARNEAPHRAQEPVTYAEGVFRGLLSPRWAGLTLLMVGVVAACVLLGLWQLGVARDEGRKEAVAAAAALPRLPLEQVTLPHSPFEAEFSNRPVTVTGRYAAELGFVVPERRLGGRDGSWVVTPLVTEAGTVAVLRGFVDGVPSQVPPPPTGEVTLTGTLGPGESPRQGPPLPDGQRRSVDLAALVNEWPGDLYNVVVLASAEVGASGVGVTTDLTRVPPPQLDAPLNLKNAAYAVQWWLFGLFAVWMWWKMFRAEHAPPADAPATTHTQNDSTEGVPA